MEQVQAAYFTPLKFARQQKAQCSKSEIFMSNKKIDRSTALEIAKIEKELVAETSEKLDFKRVTDFMLEEKDGEQMFTPWKISFASATFFSLFFFGVWHSYTVSAVVFVTIYLLALGDPAEEDSVAGAFTRVIGRSALKLMYTMQPRTQSIIRATIKGDEEIKDLRTKVLFLEEENKRLKLLLRRREAIDDAMTKYTLGQLKEIAKRHQIPGYSTMTKEKLLTKIVEKEIQ